MATLFQFLDPVLAVLFGVMLGAGLRLSQTAVTVASIIFLLFAVIRVVAWGVQKRSLRVGAESWGGETHPQ